MEREMPTYYSILPANVRYADNLSLLQKLLFSEITALSQKEGYCFASNDYFAKLYGKNSKYISGILNDMAIKGYLTIQVEKTNGNLRKIWIAIQKNLDTYSEKPDYPYSEKPEHNNINNNNKTNNTTISKNLTRTDDINNVHKEILATYNSLFRPARPSKDISWVKNANYWLSIYTPEEIIHAINNWYKFPHWSKDGKNKCELSFLFRTKNKNGECNYIEEMLYMDVKTKSLAEIKFDEEFENAI